MQPTERTVLVAVPILEEDGLCAFGKLAEQLAGKMMLAIPLGRMRIDLGLREIARERLDLPLVLSEVEVHVDRDDTWAPFAGNARVLGPGSRRPRARDGFRATSARR